MPITPPCSARRRVLQCFFAFFVLCSFFTSCSRPTTTYHQERVPVKTAEKKEIVQPRPREKMVIMLDAGHGGKDLGTHSSSHKYQEKNLSLSTTLIVRDYLRRWGYEVHLTREKDVFVSLENRAEMANRQPTAIFVSIHYNSSPSTSASGIEVFCFRAEQKTPREKESHRLAQAILNEILVTTRAQSRGVKEANYSVLRQTKMPAVLIEGGFLTNAKERDLLKNPKYVHALAQGIARGIDEYLRSRKPLHHGSK